MSHLRRSSDLPPALSSLSLPSLAFDSELHLGAPLLSASALHPSSSVVPPAVQPSTHPLSLPMLSSFPPLDTDALDSISVGPQIESVNSFAASSWSVGLGQVASSPLPLAVPAVVLPAAVLRTVAPPPRPRRRAVLDPVAESARQAALREDKKVSRKNAAAAKAAAEKEAHELKLAKNRAVYHARQAAKTEEQKERDRQWDSDQRSYRRSDREAVNPQV
jgi:hypothetical protein